MTEPDRNAEPPQRLEQLDRLRELARRRESAREAGNAPPPAARPGWRFLRHPAHCIALGFGSGLAPVAAGTAGTLWAWGVWAWLVAPWLSAPAQGALAAAALPLGWWACAVTARKLGQPDPRAIVWDEVAAFWLVLWLIPAAWGWASQAVAFALFRLFDAAKPGPVRWADQLFHDRGGWLGALGIMLDDLVAAACTLLAVALAARAGWLPLHV